MPIIYITHYDKEKVMAVRFKKGVNWDAYGIDILKYDFLPFGKTHSKKQKEQFIDTEGLKLALLQEGVDTDAVRRKFMGLE